MDWRVFFAAAAGGHHRGQHAPCQDFVCHRVRQGVFVGVVCDGAGSASAGGIGAEFLATEVTHLLSQALETHGLPEETSEDYRAFVTPLLEQARTALEAHAEPQTLRDHACTLVGCLASRSGGCFFHIGDGFAVQQGTTGAAILSLPENGEYANETYFATDPDWRDHLRVTMLSQLQRGDLIGLMSDGASAFAIDKLKTGFYKPFIDPVAAFLQSASEPHGKEALQNLLESEKTLEITSDDKTLLLAFVG
ncbi:MAG: protein phosphatase 2C domain-containing protein [Ferrovum sp.]|nr:protein phosphatase 2C domain-containing protein [Ferrovum sp.]